MKIDLICHDGSPLGVIPPHIYGRGVGGAELSMMSLMEVLAKRGHEITVYNNPEVEGIYDDVHYVPKKGYITRGKRDVLIVFRSPNPMLISATAKVIKIWWSTDQYTVGNFKALSALVDFCVTISPHHTNHHLSEWGIDPKKMGHIDLGVRLQDYDQEVEKVRNQMIFCSIPDRGLRILHAAWPLILKEVPEATLFITSDYRLWGGRRPNNARHRLDWAGMQGVTFLGKIERTKMVKLQLESEIMPYPCTYEELFCISAAECQISGAFPVTTVAGALKTTNEFGIKVTGNLTNPLTLQEGFVDIVVGLLTKEREYLEERARIMKVSARQRFDWEKIADRWEYLFEEGRLPR